MKEYYQHNFPLYRRETIGFALFLAWVFCVLFGCGLVTPDMSLTGTPATHNLERIWMASGLFEALGGLAGLIAARFTRMPDALARSRAVGTTALALALAGNVLTWLAWTDRFSPLWAFHIPGGALTGLAVAFFIILWSERLSSYDEAHLEFSIPLSFTVAFALYCVLLLSKQGSLSFLVLLLALISVSFWLAWRQGARARQNDAGPRPHPPLPQGLLSFAVLVCASWIQIAFFRVLSTPAVAGDRIVHFLIPFTCACVLSLIMLALCLRLSRYLNISLAYRWSLPLFMLSYVPLFVDYGNPALRLVGYAINFLGMFGVQFGCWLGACKYLRRTGASTLYVFGGYAAGEGLGIFFGCIIGLFAVEYLDEGHLLVLSFILLAFVVFAIMVTGFNPQWIFNRSRTHSGGKPAKAGGSSDLNALFEQEARRLQASYDLTVRETDVAALLLAGRSRPYIRDELTVSINTVSSHVRSIFSKCGVHSHQELIDLARKGSGASGPPAGNTAERRRSNGTLQPRQSA